MRTPEFGKAEGRIADPSASLGMTILFGNGKYSFQDELSSRQGGTAKVVPLYKAMLSAPSRYCFAAILRMVLVVLTPSTVGTISTRPPQVDISSAPTMVELV